ncbi:MAG: flagellar hook-basal body protein [Chloroflexota bacterium]|nr:flagellar hook-basal body protein [Chloroflexota bacterium]
MEVSQRIAVTGMLASQRQLEVISNNLANVNSSGFKKAVAQTTDVGYQAGLTAPVGQEGQSVRLVGIGEGTQVASVHHEFMPGALQATGSPLDIALQGDGFFSVRMPDGSLGYTRDGSFSLESQGRLVTAGGQPVVSETGGDLTVPLDAVAAHFDESGQLVATDPAGLSQSVGRLALSRFPNNRGLQAQGQNLWTPTAASGAATAIAAGAVNGPLIVPGALEASNVDIGDEFTRLIQAQRGYQLNSKVVQAWDDIARMANELRRP